MNTQVDTYIMREKIAETSPSSATDQGGVGMEVWGGKEDAERKRSIWYDVGFCLRTFH